VPKLSVTVITKNEAANIERALESVAWADELIVVDAESTDDTPRLAKLHRPGGGAAWPGWSIKRTTRRRLPQRLGVVP
jgi:hypothetical protein